MDKNYEVRNEGQASLLPFSRTIEGYAAVFNKLSNPIPGQLSGKNVVFREMILPGAFDGLIDTQDVTANFDHNDENGILARSRNGIGSLRLSIDGFGLKYSFEAPETTLGNDMLQGLKRGDIDSSSFAFIVAKGGERWAEQSTGIYIRSISKISKLCDVSLVVRPAYDAAKVYLRGLEEFVNNRDLSGYYEEIKNRIRGTSTDNLSGYYENMKKQYGL
ncbi:MAG TPA: HK97 family phage prohead protease [Prolixibacteraceae bacterium]|jgi:hypothetical protein